jgi:hypothetical protein
MYIAQEQSDIFVDAAVTDPRSQLMFISLYGRDTSIQQFMARLHQSRREGGIEEVNLSKPGTTAPHLLAFVGDPKRLTKHTGRLPRGLLGNLVHAWIFDPALLEADQTTRSGYVFETLRGTSNAGSALEGPKVVDDIAAFNTHAWQLIKQLSPVPMLDAWKRHFLERPREQSGLSLTRCACIGAVHATRVELGEGFARYVCEAVRTGDLLSRHLSHTAVPSEA